MEQQLPVYFANETDPKKLGAQLMERVQQYEKYVQETGLFEIWKLAYRLWYSQDEEGFTAHTIGKKGPKGKLAVLKFNHFRSIVKNWRTLASAQRAAMQPVVKFSGSRSDEQVKRAKVALDHYAVASQLDKLRDEAVDIASILGASHLEQCWYDDGGEIVVPMNADALLSSGKPGQETIDQAGNPVAGPKAYGPDRVGAMMTGTITGRVYSPVDFIVDPQRMDHRFKWCITRHYDSKWDIAARYARNDKEYADILELSKPKDERNAFELQFAPKDREFSTDDIPVYTFWHERTPACPTGKKIVFLNGEIVFDAKDLGRLRSVPVRRIAPANILRSPFGYSEAWDLLAPQRACDILTSVSLSNIRTFGVGSIISPKGSGVKASEVTEGLKLIEYNSINGEKPDVLKLPSTPAEVYRAQESWVKQMGTLIGVNGVTRGDPEKSLESGSALALVQAQSVQYSSDFQNEIVDFQQETATDTIQLVQENLKSAVEFAVLGDEIASMDKFSGSEIDAVLRVEVKPVNPMTKTMGGRWQMASFLAERYPDRVTPQQVIHMVANGSLDPITDDIETAQRNIQRENALLAKGIGPAPKVPMLDPATGMPAVDPMTGKPKMQRQPTADGVYVTALISDNPLEHVKKHLALLDSPARRSDPKIVQAVLDHVEDHEELYAMLTMSRPGLLEMLQIPPLTAALPPDPMAMGGEGGAPGEPGKSNGPGPVRPGPEKGPPDSGGPAKMPTFPKNPSNGERYQPPQPQE